MNMNILFGVIKFLIGLGILLLCTIGAYYIGLMIIGPVVTSGLAMSIDTLGRWSMGLLVILMFGLLVFFCYKLGDLIID